MKFQKGTAGNARKLTAALLFTLTVAQGFSQTYAPGVGLAGTSAMYKDSSAFVNWATGCTITRGFQDISDPSLGLASVGDASMAAGKAQSNPVISLGDGGVAICTFEKPIANGPGYDFAIFENGFDDQFLELAFVEVSSDGVNFYRFKAHSLTDTSVQTSSFGATDPVKINNLAGKYRGGYGTPFDLDEFAHLSSINVSAITHVKIIDVVGSINSQYATRDFYGNKINEPWPTAFPSGGFDLDAIGVIHQSGITGINEEETEQQIAAYPNPVRQGQEVTFPSGKDFESAELRDISGKLVLVTGENHFSSSELKPGFYCLVVKRGESVAAQKIVVY